MARLLPLLAVVSLAHAQETTTDTSSGPDQADDPPVALQQDSPVELADNNLPAVNDISGQKRVLPGHKVDGTITN